MESSSSSSSPHLPTEIKGHILSFCDQSTLAKTASLSLAFLHLSSPLLYEDVVLYGVRNLHKLFCSREDPSFQSHLHPYLALTQIKQFTFFVEDGDVPLYPTFPPLDPIQLNQDRLSSTFLPLSLRSLTIFLRLQPQMMCYGTFINLLLLVDPTSFQLEGYGPYSERRTLSLSTMECYEMNWNRLRRISYKNAGLSNILSTVLSTIDPSFVVRYDLSDMEPGSKLWRSTVSRLTFDLTDSSSGRTQTSSGFIFLGLEMAEFWVATQEGKQEILDHLRQKCERSFGIAGWEKMRRNLEVTVVSPST
ncbi:hypothetical protein BDY24DRAFT_132363 [Mrakia frigida]|uniref:uncharacterized protein n=1 Tax=Mrakia frigida TaxID=29902 RepID=UPI003FCC0C3A